MGFTSTASAQSSDFAIAIHGGAGGDPAKWTDQHREYRTRGLTKALDEGVRMLEEGQAALDVVEAVVRILEDDETFNAGRGCVLTRAGEHELDASIMDGSTLRCGAVAAVTTVRNPISLARAVMEQTKHVLLIGNGADQFGRSLGFPQEDADYFRTDRKKVSWERWKQGQADLSLYRPGGRTDDDEQLYLGTVGCVVRDQQGNLAAATSTGGLMGKRWGRVGDSPIIGAGNYANRACAVSGTGIGEEFIRNGIAFDIAARLKYTDASLDGACQAAIALLPEDAGGVIAVDADGNISMQFNTPGMSRAFADSTGQRGVLLGKTE